MNALAYTIFGYFLGCFVTLFVLYLLSNRSDK